MDKFTQILEKKTEDFFPTPKKLSKFYESAVKTSQDLGVVLNEQDFPPEEAPAAVGPEGPPQMQAGPPGAEEPEEPDAPELDNKPYNILAWIAYRALMIDPAEVSGSAFYDQLQDLTDGGDKAGIDSPEKGVRVFQTIEQIIKNLESPVDSDLPPTE